MSFPRLYLDLDGVFADFDRHYADLFGHYHKAIPDAELWGKIHSMPTFFRDMPVCPGAKEFFFDVRKSYLWGDFAELSVLTACPKEAYAHVAGQKREWVREHLSRFVTVLPVAGGSSKPLFMHEPGDILIDDFERNTKAWEAAGGRAILHAGDFELTRAALKSLLETSQCSA